MYYIQHQVNPDKVCMQIADMKIPEIIDTQILIKVSASGINRPDLLQRQGLYPAPQNASPILGLEVSGIVEKIGQNVTNVDIGDAVCALVPGGGYAEYCVTEATHCLPMPAYLTDCEAACLPEALFTLYSLLWHQGNLRPRETVLIHGGNSGIASLAGPILKAMGHKVIITLRSNKHLETCHKLYLADHIIIAQDGDFLTELRQIHASGVDVILDLAGATYLQQNIYALAPQGRLVLMGLMSGAKSQINLTRILTHRLTVTGATLRPQTDRQKTAFAHTIRTNLLPLLNQHKIKPLLHQILDFQEADKAHKILNEQSIIGKICLKH